MSKLIVMNNRKTTGIIDAKLPINPGRVSVILTDLQGNPLLDAKGNQKTKMMCTSHLCAIGYRD